jgi:hypothetical protein
MGYGCSLGDAIQYSIHSFLFDADLFRRTGISFDESLPTHEDWDCWMRILEVDPIVVHTPGELELAGVYQEAQEAARGTAVQRTIDMLRRIAPWRLQVWVRRLTVQVFLRLGVDIVW